MNPEQPKYRKTDEGELWKSNLSASEIDENKKATESFENMTLDANLYDELPPAFDGVGPIEGNLENFRANKESATEIEIENISKILKKKDFLKNKISEIDGGRNILWKDTSEATPEDMEIVRKLLPFSNELIELQKELNESMDFIKSIDEIIEEEARWVEIVNKKVEEYKNRLELN